jgi:heme A synthase
MKYLFLAMHIICLLAIIYGEISQASHITSQLRTDMVQFMLIFLLLYNIEDLKGEMNNE